MTYYRRRAAWHAVSQNAVNCINKLYNKSTKYRSNGVEGYSWSTCSKQPRLVDCRIHVGVGDKLYRRGRRWRVLLTKRSTCRGEVQSLGQSLRKKYPNFWRRAYPNFLITQSGIGGRKPPCQNAARFVRSFGYDTDLWETDRQKDGQTDGHNDSLYALAERRAVKTVERRHQRWAASCSMAALPWVRNDLF